MSPDKPAAVSRVKLLAAFAAVYFVWGSTYLFIHFALEDLPPFTLASARFLTAGLILYSWTRLHGAPRPSRRQWRACFITGGLFFLCGNGAVVWAQQRLPSGIAALLVAIVPLWVVMLEWIRPPHKHPRALTFAGVIVGLLGLALLLGPNAFSQTAVIDPTAALVLACGSLCWAFGTLWAQRAPLPKSPLLTASMQLLAGGLLLGVLALATREVFGVSPSNISLSAILSMLYLIFFGSILAFTAYGWLVRVAPASRVATYAYVNPVVALLLGWLFADERLNGRTIIACGIVVVGVALITGGTARGNGSTD